MDDALRAAGAVGGLGVAVILGVVAWRIGTDTSLTWFVVGGLMLCVILVLVIVALMVYRHAMEARAATLWASQEHRLTSMRSIALVKDAAPRSDPWAALMASMPVQDVVDGTGQVVDYDHGAHNGTE